MDRRQTTIIRVDADSPDDRLLMPAADALRRGELVAFPTETVYGLGANALDSEAVASIFKVKGRPADNPLIVHIASLQDLPALVREISPMAMRLLEAFTPGPLTLVLPKSPIVPGIVTAGLDTVAVRIPSHKVARRLIELAGVPVAAPSANRSGRPSPTRGWHVAADLDGRIPYIIESGSSRYGLESTVVDMTGEEPVILRPGAITASAILAVAGRVGGIIDDKPSSLGLQTAEPRSPGLKYRHYAPKAKVFITEGDDAESRAAHLCSQAAQLLSEYRRIGIFACRRSLSGLQGSFAEIDLKQAGLFDPETTCGLHLPEEITAVVYAEEPDAVAAGRDLFDALRSLDQLGVEAILAEGLPGHGVGTAYMNRLRKASAAAGSEQIPQQAP
jgi:L-threonylcarbamoyladenylate synthase